MGEPAASSSSAKSAHAWRSGTFNGRRAARRISKSRDGLYYVLADESPLGSDDGTESEQSIQAKETDFAKNTTDTDPCSSSCCSGDSRSRNNIREYQIATDGYQPLNYSSGNSNGKEMITTKVISVLDKADAEFADSEDSLPGAADPELGMSDYWACVQCRSRNNNPMFRYCEKCYKARKKFDPPRPKRKRKKPRQKLQKKGLSKFNEISEQVANSTKAPFNSQSSDGVQVDSGVDSVYNTQELIRSQKSDLDFPTSLSPEESVAKSKKTSLDEAHGSNMCIECLSEPKSGVFVHGRIAHICCCYKCALKVWITAKRCPVCNGKVSNVLKAIVM